MLLFFLVIIKGESQQRIYSIRDIWIFFKLNSLKGTCYFMRMFKSHVGKIHYYTYMH